MEDKELKVMASNVRAAAKKCSTADSVLRNLFPEAFVSPRFRRGQLFMDMDDNVFILAKTGMVGSSRPTWRLINIFTGEKSREEALKGKTINQKEQGNPLVSLFFEPDDEDAFAGYRPMPEGMFIRIETTAEGNIFQNYGTVAQVE